MPVISKVGGERTLLLTTEDAARELGVSPRTIRNYCTTGRIPYCTIGRTIYIWDKHLMAFIRGARTTRTYKKISPPKFEAEDFPPDPICFDG